MRLSFSTNLSSESKGQQCWWPGGGGGAGLGDELDTLQESTGTREVATSQLLLGRGRGEEQRTERREEGGRRRGSKAGIRNRKPVTAVPAHCGHVTEQCSGCLLVGHCDQLLGDRPGGTY